MGNHLDGYAVAAGKTVEYVEGRVRIVEAHRALGLTLDVSRIP